MLDLNLILSRLALAMLLATLPACSYQSSYVPPLPTPQVPWRARPLWDGTNVVFQAPFGLSPECTKQVADHDLVIDGPSRGHSPAVYYGARWTSEDGEVPRGLQALSPGLAAVADGVRTASGLAALFKAGNGDNRALGYILLGTLAAAVVAGGVIAAVLPDTAWSKQAATEIDRVNQFNDLLRARKGSCVKGHEEDPY